MSYWTHILGIVKVDMSIGETQPEIEYILQTVLNHLPVVSGSERDMEVHIVKENGANFSSSCDEFGESTNNLIDSYGQKSRKSGWLHTQTNYILVVNGNLRDKFFDDTYKDFQKWLCRLSKRLEVDDVLVKIYAYEREAIITNKNDVYRNMYENFSWCKDSNGEPNWCEYLLPVKVKNSMYPMLFAYKYFSDEENDREVQRRMKYMKGEKQ